MRDLRGRGVMLSAKRSRLKAYWEMNVRMWKSWINFFFLARNWKGLPKKLLVRGGKKSENLWVPNSFRSIWQKEQKRERDIASLTHYWSMGARLTGRAKQKHGHGKIARMLLKEKSWVMSRPGQCTTTSQSMCDSWDLSPLRFWLP